MKKLLGVSILAGFFAACADSGQGSAPETETGVNSSGSSAVDVEEPGVAADPGTRPVISTGAVSQTPARPVPVPSGSEATPESSRTVPAIENQSPPAESSDLNEQGAQTSPEPKTGDDANPDLVNPRR